MVEILIDGTPRTILLGENTAVASFAAAAAAASASSASASAAFALATAPYIPPQRAASYANAVRGRWNASTGAAALTLISGGGVASPAVAIAYNDALFTRTGQPACYRASGTVSSAGFGPRFSIPISVADLALAGLVPDDTTPPRFSVRAAIQLGSLVNQTIDASVSGTSFLNGFWYVILRYAGAGAALAGPNNASTDVVFLGTSGTPTSGIGIGSGDSLWAGSTGSQTLNADEKIMRRQNVPLRATYSGQALSGVILQFSGNAAAVGATSIDIGRVALVPGATISETTNFLNLPEDAVFAVARRNLPAELLTKVDSAATESPIAARITAVNGSNPAAWALGMDQAWDFTTGLTYAGASLPTDAHAAPLWVRNQSGFMQSVAINALAQAEAVGLMVQPARTELISTPRNFGAVYTTTGGTGSITQNRRGPDGAANTAYTLTDSDGAAYRAQQRNLTVTNDSLSHTAMVYIRKTKAVPPCYPSVQVGYAGGTGISGRLSLDTLTGKTYVDPGGAATWAVEDAGEFWKVSGSIANNSTGNTTFFHVFNPARGTTFPTQSTAAQGSHVFAWASMQKDSFAATDLPDGGSGGGNMVVADQAAFSGAVAGLITLNVRGAGGTGVRLFSLDDGTTNNYLALEWVSGNAVLRLLSGGAEQAAVVLDQWRTGRQTIAFVAGSNYVWGQFLRGLSVTADTSATYPTLTKLGFGGNSVSTATRRANVVIEKMALRYGVADADTAAEMLERAAVAHGDAPEFFDNFDRADGALGDAASGHKWLQQPADGACVVATISGKKLVAADSGTSATASYNAALLERPVKKVRARMSFNTDASGGGLGLILTRTPPPIVAGSPSWITVDGAVHLVFTDVQINVGLYLNSDFFEFDVVRYPNTLARDGTIYEVGYTRERNAVVLFAPNMAPIWLTHPRILQLAGPYVAAEPYWGTGLCQARVHEVAAW